MRKLICLLVLFALPVFAQNTKTAKAPVAVFDTTAGTLRCTLFPAEAPKTVDNFIGLAEGTKDWKDPATGAMKHGVPLYNGTIFHRVIPNFMIQGGDPTGTGMGSPGYKFEDEATPKLTFDRPGRLAMANSGSNTNGSQFFITEAPYPSLNGHYSLFGQCDDQSVEVVKKIARMPTGTSPKTGAPNYPLNPVKINKITIEGWKKPAAGPDATK